MGQSLDEALFFGVVIDIEAYPTPEWMEGWDPDTTDWEEALWASAERGEMHGAIEVGLCGYMEYGYTPAWVAYRPSVIKSLTAFEKIRDPRQTLGNVDLEHATKLIHQFLAYHGIPPAPTGWYLTGSIG